MFGEIIRFGRCLQMCRIIARWSLKTEVWIGDQNLFASIIFGYKIASLRGWCRKLGGVIMLVGG